MNNTIASNSGVSDLGRFTNLKTLVLDHNNFTNMRYFPELPNLETLSLAYNSVRDLDQTLTTIHTKYPCIKHLNFIKNPINPIAATAARTMAIVVNLGSLLPELGIPPELC